jgi:hypothetical protein
MLLQKRDAFLEKSVQALAASDWQMWLSACDVAPARANSSPCTSQPTIYPSAIENATLIPQSIIKNNQCAAQQTYILD